MHFHSAFRENKRQAVLTDYASKTTPRLLQSNLCSAPRRAHAQKSVGAWPKSGVVVLKPADQVSSRPSVRIQQETSRDVKYRSFRPFERLTHEEKVHCTCIGFKPSTDLELSEPRPEIGSAHKACHGHSVADSHSQARLLSQPYGRWPCLVAHRGGQAQAALFALKLLSQRGGKN